MCGISGGYNVPKETIEKMCAHQSSRGPDATGIKEVGKVIFGHDRLSIIGKSEKSNQPIIGGETMLSYNGEIYNYDISLRSDTESLFCKFFSRCSGDANVPILCNELNGMFAFAFYRENQIYLIRDRFGIKPLYFYKDENFFAFASTPAAVALTKENWSVSQKGVQEYLSLGATMLHSMFEGIEAVPPGHYVTFNCRTQEFHVKRWYYPKFIENAYEVIQEKVTKAIDRVKCTCDWPQIILLSGGIDSSLVASRYIGQDAIHLASPEEEEAKKVAQKFAIDLHSVHPADYSAEECLTDYITKSGDPTMAGLIPYITCSEIKKQGFRVAITANGADELFFGYDRMRDLGEQNKAIFRDFGFNSGWYNDIWKLYDMPNTADSDSIHQWVEILYYLMFDLNKTLDFASMCHSVEVRVPYLDHELVEAALSIPMDKHIWRLGNKTILKEMLLKFRHRCRHPHFQRE